MQSLKTELIQSCSSFFCCCCCCCCLRMSNFQSCLNERTLFPTHRVLKHDNEENVLMLGKENRKKQQTSSFSRYLSYLISLNNIRMIKGRWDKWLKYNGRDDERISNFSCKIWSEDQLGNLSINGRVLPVWIPVVITLYVPTIVALNTLHFSTYYIHESST
jgi:hypothetical protein